MPIRHGRRDDEDGVEEAEVEEQGKRWPRDDEKGETAGDADEAPESEPSEVDEQRWKWGREGEDDSEVEE